MGGEYIWEIFLILKSEISRLYKSKQVIYVLTGCGFSGPPQQYSGQEDYYGDQYSHGGQGPPEGMNQQYYPDGNLS